MDFSFLWRQSALISQSPLTVPVLETKFEFLILCHWMADALQGTYRGLFSIEIQILIMHSNKGKKG